MRVTKFAMYKINIQKSIVPKPYNNQLENAIVKM